MGLMGKERGGSGSTTHPLATTEKINTASPMHTRRGERERDGGRARTHMGNLKKKCTAFSRLDLHTKLTFFFLLRQLLPSVCVCVCVCKFGGA